MPYKTGSWGIQSKVRGETRLEYFREYQRGRYKRNMIALRNSNIAYYRKVRKLVLDKMGNKCQKCGFSDWRALQIDHVGGGGSQEEREISGIGIYLNILKGNPRSKKYQLLCANCNFIKRYENNELAVRHVGGGDNNG